MPLVASLASDLRSPIARDVSTFPGESPCGANFMPHPAHGPEVDRE